GPLSGSSPEQTEGNQDESQQVFHDCSNHRRTHSQGTMVGWSAESPRQRRPTETVIIASVAAVIRVNPIGENRRKKWGNVPRPPNRA
ncbi:MAG: hypothetical protein ACK5PZ_12685, partial [Pirellula sp.]